jgi:hypothetical protein
MAGLAGDPRGHLRLRRKRPSASSPLARTNKVPRGHARRNCRGTAT